MTPEADLTVIPNILPPTLPPPRPGPSATNIPFWSTFRGAATARTTACGRVRAGALGAPRLTRADSEQDWVTGGCTQAESSPPQAREQMLTLRPHRPEGAAQALPGRPAANAATAKIQHGQEKRKLNRQTNKTPQRAESRERGMICRMGEILANHTPDKDLVSGIY